MCIRDRSKTEILAEIPRLSHRDRRGILRLISEIEEDAETLGECERLAVERFQRLDAMATDANGGQP